MLTHRWLIVGRYLYIVGTLILERSGTFSPFVEQLFGLLF